MFFELFKECKQLNHCFLSLPKIKCMPYEPFGVCKNLNPCFWSLVIIQVLSNSRHENLQKFIYLTYRKEYFTFNLQYPKSDIFDKIWDAILNVHGIIQHIVFFQMYTTHKVYNMYTTHRVYNTYTTCIQHKSCIQH